MAYTLLRATEAGVVLADYHLRRLSLSKDSAARNAFIQFTRRAQPGVWAVWTDPVTGIQVEERPGTRLRDGIPVRLATSPVLGGTATIAKSAPPSAYERVRVKGRATLLTSADGQEIFEACSAAAMAWDGQQLVCVPSDRPRVWSTSETAIRDHFPVHEAPISPSCASIVLVNAVKGTCLLAEPYSQRFPLHIRERLEQLFIQLTRRLI
jgi:hypothetical protein